MTTFKIAHHNIRGLNHNINDLKIYIQENNPDIITINETLQIKPNTKIFNYTITQPGNNTGQGVCIIHKNNIKIDTLDEIRTTQKNYKPTTLNTSNTRDRNNTNSNHLLPTKETLKGNH